MSTRIRIVPRAAVDRRRQAALPPRDERTRMTHRPDRQRRRPRRSSPRARPRPRLPLVVGAGGARPAGDRRRLGLDGLGPRGQRSYLDFSSQLVNVNIGHQHPAVVAAIQEQAALLATIGPGDREPRARRGRAAHPRARRRTGSTRCSSRTAAPTPTRTRSGWRACTPAATRCSRPTARTTATPGRRSSRRATGDGCRTSTPAGTCTSSVPTSTAASSGRRRPRRSPSAPCTTSSASSSRRGRRRSPRSCWRPIPGTAGILVPPPGYLAGRPRALPTGTASC